MKDRVNEFSIEGNEHRNEKGETDGNRRSHVLPWVLHSHTRERYSVQENGRARHVFFHSTNRMREKQKLRIRFD